MKWLLSLSLILGSVAPGSLWGDAPMTQKLHNYHFDFPSYQDRPALQETPLSKTVIYPTFPLGGSKDSESVSGDSGVLQNLMREGQGIPEDYYTQAGWLFVDGSDSNLRSDQGFQDESVIPNGQKNSSEPWEIRGSGVSDEDYEKLLALFDLREGEKETEARFWGVPISGDAREQIDSKRNQIKKEVIQELKEESRGKWRFSLVDFLWEKPKKSFLRRSNSAPSVLSFFKKQIFSKNSKNSFLDKKKNASSGLRFDSLKAHRDPLNKNLYLTGQKNDDQVFTSEVPDQALKAAISEDSSKNTKPLSSGWYDDQIDSYFKPVFEAISEDDLPKVLDQTAGQKSGLLSSPDNSIPEEEFQNDQENQASTENAIFDEERMTPSEGLIVSKSGKSVFRTEGDRSGGTPQAVKSENSEAPKEKFRLSNWLSKKWASFKNALKTQKKKTPVSVEKGWTYKDFSKSRETELL